VNVRKLALNLCKQLCSQTDFCHLDTEAVLDAAAMLHELGLHIEYKKHHDHGAYILNYIDLPGYTRLQRAAIRDLVKCHRQTIDIAPFNLYHDDVRTMLMGLLRILRIAVVVCLRRHQQHIPEITLEVNEHDWTLTFPEGWLKEHPLINAELVNEAWLQHRAGWHLTCV
jgi:exopolyphosphatase/guanosine-5'-triphosphate,3'-diphosphate pyrophosphatase